MRVGVVFVVAPDDLPSPNARLVSNARHRSRGEENAKYDRNKNRQSDYLLRELSPGVF